MHTLFIIIITSLFLVAWQVATLKYTKKTKILLFVVLYFGIIYMPLGIFFYLGLKAPHFIVFIFSFINATTIILISIGILRFLVATLSILTLFTKGGKDITKYLFLSPKISLFSLIFSLIFGAFSLYEAAKIPQVKEYEFTYKNLPSELDGYKIAHISDTHIGVLFRAEWTKSLVELVNKQNANLIVHTGDIADAMPDEVTNSIKHFLDLKAQDGVYFVMGNHENYHSITKWREFYKKHNLNLLENEYVIHKNLPLTIVGAKAERRTALLDYDEFLQGSPQKNFTLLLDHYPNRANKSKEYINLQLSGHTHGGTTFYLAPIVAKFNGGFVNGLYNLSDDMKLFVTSCAGLWSYAPLRFFVPSEVAIIKLVKGVEDF